MKTPITVTVTGAAGQIAYSLLFRIASGSMLGPDQPINLRLLEIPPAMNALEGVVMELRDAAFPLVNEIVPTSDPDEAFAGANWCLLVGSVPRKAGMERKDLLDINGKVFIGQGQAIARSAAKDVRVLVVGNPCNTNALIAMHNASGVPSDRFFAMTRLDENRAKSQLAEKAGVHVTEVTNMAIWGNHSSTQYPDFTNARIGGKPVTEVIKDTEWLKGDFITTVQQRGAAIIKHAALLPPLPPLPQPWIPSAAWLPRLRKATGIPWPFAPTVPTALKKVLSAPSRSAPPRMAAGKSCRGCRLMRSPVKKLTLPLMN